ncbi:hypothetical protein ACPW96_16735 [Micromonospora sp. DT81.3]
MLLGEDSSDEPDDRVAVRAPRSSSGDAELVVFCSLEVYEVCSVDDVG